VTALDRYPALAEADVAVLGAGSAGSAAAIAAARAGAATLLIDKNGFLGGTSTAILDTFYGFYTPGEHAIKVVGGIADDIVAGLRELGPVVTRPNTFGAGTGITYHPDHLKVVWEQQAAAAGARVVLHAFLQDAHVSDGHISSVLVATKAGLRQIRARVFIDATGDADLCHFAGFGYEQAGEVAPAQTLTTTFRMCNVDLARRATMSRPQLRQLMADAAASGRYRLPRLEGSDHITPVEHMTATIMTRVPSMEHLDGRLINATDPGLLSRAEMTGRAQALEYVRFLQENVPGYEHAQLASLSSQIGVRETRRVYGDYRLTREDVLSGRQFDDQVGLCGAPIEDHHDGADTHWEYLPDGAAVGIPVRTLIPRGSANVLVAGRCFSATHDAHASVRSMAQCMAMGHAAGEAAAIAARRRVPVRDLDVRHLQDRLRTAGACLEIEENARAAASSTPRRPDRGTAASSRKPATHISQTGGIIP
jgi:glycine/D-amino acid oxidase-like deaminating enzyme